MSTAESWQEISRWYWELCAPHIAKTNAEMAAMVDGFRAECGGDRQALHEAIRRHSVDTAKQIKLHGGDNDLLDRIAADPAFGLTRAQIDAILDEGGFTGMAEAQTETFLRDFVRPLLDKYQSIGRVKVEINI